VILAGPAVLGALAVVGAGAVGGRDPRPALGLAAAAGAGVVAVLLFGLRPILDRFAPPVAGAPEVRLEAWPHVLDAARSFLPLGAGLGSFDRVFRAAEPLTLVTPLYFNHAHNDYLELLLETGVVGAAILALFLLWLAPAAWAAWRRGTDLARAASVSIGLLLAQSAVDYPLRTETVAVLFAFCCGLLARPDPARG
jgi:O-antigen ligase